MDFFTDILKEVGRLLNVALKPDAHDSCAIVLRDKITLRLELDKARENLIIGSEIGELPPGRYREEVLKAALLSNGAPPPLMGTFAFSKRRNALICFEMMDVKDFTPDRIVALLPPLIEKAEKWQEALLRGQVPQPAPHSGDARGLRP